MGEENTYYSKLPLIRQDSLINTIPFLRSVYKDDGGEYYVDHYNYSPAINVSLQEEQGNRNGVKSRIRTWFDGNGNVATSDTTYNDTWYYPRTQKYIELQNRFEGYPRSRDPFNYLNYSK